MQAGGTRLGFALMHVLVRTQRCWHMVRQEHSYVSLMRIELDTHYRTFHRARNSAATEKCVKKERSIVQRAQELPQGHLLQS